MSEVIGKYVRVESLPQASGRKTQRWVLRAVSDSEILGLILWRTGWRCYTLEPRDNTVFNAGCLTDIAAFLKRETEKVRKKRSST